MLSLLVLSVTPAAIRKASGFDARLAARTLLVLRLLPSTFAGLLVLGICVPSYLWLEPETSGEQVSSVCLAAAFFGVAVLSISAARGLRASRRSLRYVRECERTGRQSLLNGEPTPVLIVDGGAPLLALTGIVRPRIVLSQPVVRALSASQLSAVLRHERAHRTSHDNLKRLLILLAPAAWPFFRGFDSLERAWARVTEWAADDQAVDGDEQRSLSLAAALVCVARLGTAAQAPPLATSLMADSEDLSARVERLLRPSPPRATWQRGSRIPVAGAALAFAGLLAVVLRSSALQGVHELLEHLIN
jgi:Zn-dependent protease with chaperone function